MKPRDLPPVDAADVKVAASGLWPDVLATLAPELRSAIDVGHRRHVPCPVHGGKDGLRVFPDFEQTGGMVCNTCGESADGFETLMWANEWDFTETLAAVAGYVGMGNGSAPPALPHTSPQTPTKDGKADEAKRRERLAKTWKATTKDTGRLSEYLRSRGLSGEVPPTLRLHPKLKYYEPDPDDPEKMRPAGTYPAMVARVVDAAGDSVTIHCLYLDADGPGKAPVETPKKTKTATREGATTGAAIRLFDPNEVLAVGEGIETMLAVHEATGLPVWSCVSAHGLGTVVLPPEVKRVTVWADNDASGTGQRTAEEAAARLTAEGREVYVLLPPRREEDGTKDTDWLDVLNVDGAAVLREARQTARVWRPEVGPEQAPELQVSNLADIEPEGVEWLWPGRVPYGKLTVLAGDPGVGKSYVSLAIATAVTLGVPLPGDEATTGKGDVLLATYEDGIADTVRPRADALGADVSRLSVIDGVSKGGRVRPFSSAHMDLFTTHLTKVPRPKLLIIDPLAAFMGGDTDTYKDNEVRSALEDLRRLAADWDIAVLCVMHLRKSAANNALARLSGSGAYGQLVRSALLAGRNPDDEGRCALAHIKHNLTVKQPTLGYRIDDGGFYWLGEEESLDGERLAGHDEDRAPREEAAAFLKDILAEGPKSAREVFSEAEDAGVAKRTLDRAKTQIGVKSKKNQDGFWRWELPQGCHFPYMTTLATLDEPDPAHPAAESEVSEGCQPPPVGEGCQPPGNLEKQAGELPPCSHVNTEAWRRNKGPWRCGICNPPAVPEGAEWYEGSDDPAADEEATGEDSPSDG